MDIGVAGCALEGGPVSGDRHIVCPFPEGLLLGVLDGLGHGTEASDAARVASATLEEDPDDSIASLFLKCHDRLRSERGVVMSLASIRHDSHTITWAGVGNVDGSLIREKAEGDSPCEALLLKAGVVGIRIPALSPAVLPLSPGDTLVLMTDGLSREVFRSLDRSVSPQQAADRILRRHRTGRDDALVLVARYREHAS